MTFLLVFWLFLFGALAIGWRAGDRRDRRAILAIGAAAALTAGSHLLVPQPLSLMFVLIVDLALLSILIRYALVTQRHWPVWFAGFHATGMMFNASALLFAGEERLALHLIGGFWAIPALFVLPVGLLADQRRGIVNAAP